MYEVILRRRNGRYVKSAKRRSRYQAKLKKRAWESNHDDAYYVEIVRLTEE